MSTYACSDIHGRGDLWDQMKAFLKPEDTLYCLGDCADRGPDGWRIIQEMLNRPNTIYLLGNHEDMMVDATIYMCSYENYTLWMYNGGRPTLEQMNKLTPDIEEQKVILKTIARLPVYTEYTNVYNEKILLSHAGFMIPHETPLEDYPQKMNQHYMRYPLTWGRTHFHYPIDVDLGVEYTMVHGHTPINYLIEDLDEFHIDHFQPNNAVWYDKYRKCDIDLASVRTGMAMLLDLDDFNEILFKGEENKWG